MNNNFKRAVLASALLLSFGAAHADTTYNIGDLTTLVDQEYSNFVSVAPGSFTDTFNFSLPTGWSAGVGVSSILGKLGTKINYDIQGLSVSLDGNGSGLNVEGYNLTAGSHTFTVTGTATGIKGGRYDFYALADVVTAPVPEPSAWAMLLGGLGLVGFMSYRRRQYY